MKNLLTVLSIFLSITIAHADELIIPFPCYPQKIAEKFLMKGYVIDLSANERTQISYGFIVSRGNEYSIFTYNPVSNEDLQKILSIAMSMIERKE